MPRLALVGLFGILIGMSDGAWAQGVGGLCPLVYKQGENLVVTYDSSLFPQHAASSLSDACSPSTPCGSVSIVVDTPLWLDSTEDLEGFRLDLQDMFQVVGSQESFQTAPEILFTNLGNDPTFSRWAYEDVIIAESSAAAVPVAVALP